MKQRVPFFRGLITIALGAVIASGALAQASTEPLEEVHAALNAGAADKALSLISSLPNAGEGNARAQNLACRVEFAMGQWDAAVRDCQQAVQLEPGNSEYHMWLGRALGEKASNANFFSAYSLGKRVLTEFQTATRLDPRNASALADLGSYYVEAPSIVGGGLDKAESVAKELDRADPARAAQLRASIAMAQGDYGTAEAQLKKAIAVSPHPAFQWTALARFYQKRKQWAAMDWALRSCLNAAEHDPQAGVPLYDAAGVLILAKREPELAIQFLQKYLASSAKTDEAPAFVAYWRLARLQKQVGDSAGAKASEVAGYELAREYNPAQDMRR
ncbi:MAG: tetratricopeptide repeat protein [Acidobacteriota bacterium]